MKKIFSILSAGVIALMAASCAQEQLATFDPSKATAPIMGSVSVGEKNVAVSYTPGVFNLGFNEKMAPTHSLAVVSVNGKPVSRLITSKDDGSMLTATTVNISKALAFFGFVDGDQVGSLDIVVRATIQNPARDNGINGFVDSERYAISNFTVTLPQGSPYADYTEATTWSVIGALSEYGISWDGDIEMFATEDGNHLVAKAVKLAKDDEFKFRKDLDWAVNMGGAFGGLDTEFSVAQDGDNIKVGADGVFDLWLDLDAGTAMVTDAYLAYPDHKDASNWSVIGALSEYGISWDGDIPMVTDGNTHVAQGVKIAAADEFKFRQDKDWAVNMGGTFGSLGASFAVEQDGANIVVGTDGIYDLILDPSGSATIVETLGGGVSGVIGGDEPEPEPSAVTGWNVIGANGDWDNDLIATEKGGVWTVYINAPEATNFKWRKDAGWDENYGGVMVALGRPFEAVPGGDNINIEAGFWKVVLDLSNEAAPTITVSEGDVWSLIGDFNSWGGDVDMVLTDGKWVSPATHLSGGFKIRHNHDWALSVGGTMTAVGEAFDAVSQDGPNISVEEGDYIVTYDLAAQKIVVDEALPTNVWSVIGGVNGSGWDQDFYMTEVVPGVWVSDVLDLEGEWKVRFNNSWDVNRGAAAKEGALTEAGQFTGAYPGGENLALTGKLQVVYNANNETIGTLGWGIVGSIASIPGFSWNLDVPMNLAPDGKWYSYPVNLGENDEIKIRWQGGWDKNFGGTPAAIDEAFDAADGGANIKTPKAGTYMLVFDPAAAKLTLSTDFWGLIGEFNGWAGDRFMLPAGDGKWYAYNQSISGGWKIRKGADWTVSAGGTYAAAGEAFKAVTTDGPNIAVTDMTRFDVLFDTKAETITASKPVK